MTELRVKFLKEFDEYIWNVIGDVDIIYDIWYALGLPDGWDENDLTEIAEDNELWLDCVNAFAKCCKVAGVM